jgi:hypothetical protein
LRFGGLNQAVTPDGRLVGSGAHMVRGVEIAIFIASPLELVTCATPVIQLRRRHRPFRPKNRQIGNNLEQTTALLINPSNMRYRVNRPQPFTHTRLGRFKIVIGLQIQPVLRRLVECATEQQGQLGGDRTRSLDDVRYAHGRNVDHPSEPGLRHAQVFQYLGQELTGMDAGQSVFDHGISLVVINDFNIEGMVTFEPEAHAPLAVDAYAPLAPAITRKLFQLVGCRHSQILDARGGMKLTQPYSRPFQDFCRQPARLTRCEEMLGFRVAEGLNLETAVDRLSPLRDPHEY